MWKGEGGERREGGGREDEVEKRSGREGHGKIRGGKEWSGGGRRREWVCLC